MHLLGDVECAAEEIATTLVTWVRNSGIYTPKCCFSRRKHLRTVAIRV